MAAVAARRRLAAACVISDKKSSMRALRIKLFVLEKHTASVSLTHLLRFGLRCSRSDCSSGGLSHRNVRVARGVLHANLSKRVNWPLHMLSTQSIMHTAQRTGSGSGAGTASHSAMRAVDIAVVVPDLVTPPPLADAPCGWSDKSRRSEVAPVFTTYTMPLTGSRATCSDCEYPT